MHIPICLMFPKQSVVIGTKVHIMTTHLPTSPSTQYFPRVAKNVLQSVRRHIFHLHIIFLIHFCLIKVPVINDCLLAF